MIDHHAISKAMGSQLVDSSHPRYGVMAAQGWLADRQEDAVLERYGDDSSAYFSRCGKYRYRLYRRWSDAKHVTFVMLNPSTADARNDDPTIRRCIGFAKDWGCGCLEVLNIFALRSTSPRALIHTFDPIGPLNNDFLLSLTLRTDRFIVAAWGRHGTLWERGKWVAQMLARRDVSLHALGANKDGTPKHPLYVPGTATAEPWP